MTGKLSRACALSIAALFFAACQGDTDAAFEVKQGPFQASITETGELQAVNVKVVPMPFYDWDYGRPPIVWLETEGKQVEVGHVIGRLDTAGVVRVRGQMEADLEIALADLEKMRVEHESALKKLAADLESAQAALQQAVIDTQRARFESENQKEIYRLRFRRMRIAYEKLQKNIEHTKNIQVDERFIQKTRVKQIRAEIEKAELTQARYILRAPAPGIIEYQRRRHRGRSRSKVEIGDELWPGEPIIGLPDLSRMKVLTSVNETDIDKIALDQPVIVRLDAFPKQEFHGKIVSIGKICVEKEDDSEIKVFDIEVLLEESGIVLRPGMTVSCEILVADLDNALYVDNRAVREEEGKYFLNLRKGMRTEKVRIDLGPRNNEYVVVYGDVKAGDEVT